MNTTSDPNCQTVCTVSQMARVLKFSRARLYQLIEAGVFPPPAYCCKTKKPIYPLRLQEMCIRIRESGIGLNSQYVRFYCKSKSTKPKAEHRQMAAALRQMGLCVTPMAVKKALRQLNLSASKAIPTDEETIKKLFEHFFEKCQQGV